MEPLSGSNSSTSTGVTYSTARGELSHVTHGLHFSGTEPPLPPISSVPSIFQFQMTTGVSVRGCACAARVADDGSLTRFAEPAFKVGGALRGSSVAGGARVARSDAVWSTGAVQLAVVWPRGGVGGCRMRGEVYGLGSRMCQGSGATDLSMWSVRVDVTPVRTHLESA
jgi:hypothetical protein